MQKPYYEYNYRFWRCKTNGFAGIYPVDTEDYELKLDGKTTVERCVVSVLPESSAALGLVSVVDFWNATHGDYSRTSRARVQHDCYQQFLTFRIMLLKKILILFWLLIIHQTCLNHHVRSCRRAVYQGYYYYKIRLCW
jgi:hypothetical protein